jgi:hypothetical protein
MVGDTCLCEPRQESANVITFERSWKVQPRREVYHKTSYDDNSAVRTMKPEQTP